MKAFLLAAALVAGMIDFAAAEDVQALQQARDRAAAAGDQAAVDRYDKRIEAVDLSPPTRDEFAAIQDLQRAEAARRDAVQDVANAKCVVIGYEAHVADIDDYVIACMRIAGYTLEGSRHAANAARFVDLCSPNARREGTCW